eukprot:4127597-Amphidinium_carterae.1
MNAVLQQGTSHSLRNTCNVIGPENTNYGESSVTSVDTLFITKRDATNDENNSDDYHREHMKSSSTNALLS